MKIWQLSAHLGLNAVVFCSTYDIESINLFMHFAGEFFCSCGNYNIDLSLAFSIINQVYYLKSWIKQVKFLNVDKLVHIILWLTRFLIILFHKYSLLLNMKRYISSDCF
jgi:hypothetical protein